MEVGGKLEASGSLEAKAVPGGTTFPSGGIEPTGTEVVVRYSVGELLRVRVVAHVVYGPDGRHDTGEWLVHERELGALQTVLDELAERHRARALARAAQHGAVSMAVAASRGEYREVEGDVEEGQS